MSRILMRFRSVKLPNETMFISLSALRRSGPSKDAASRPFLPLINTQATVALHRWRVINRARNYFPHQFHASRHSIAPRPIIRLRALFSLSERALFLFVQLRNTLSGSLGASAIRFSLGPFSRRSIVRIPHGDSNDEIALRTNEISSCAHSICYIVLGDVFFIPSQRSRRKKRAESMPSLLAFSFRRGSPATSCKKAGRRMIRSGKNEPFDVPKAEKKNWGPLRKKFHRAHTHTHGFSL